MLCSGICADLRTNPTNCGGCGNACTGSQACLLGRCVLSCPMRTTDCGGSCANLNGDRNNCGACGTVCGAGDTCAMGRCVCNTAIGNTDCGAVCTNLHTDRADMHGRHLPLRQWPHAVHDGMCGPAERPGQLRRMRDDLRSHTDVRVRILSVDVSHWNHCV